MSPQSKNEYKIMLNNEVIVKKLEDPTSECKQRSILFNIGYGILASSAGFYFGYYQSICNCLGEKLLRLHYKVDDIDMWFGYLNVFFPVGAMIGSLIAGTFGTKFGRVRTLIGAEVYIILVYGLYMIDNFYFLYIARFFSGIGAGIGAVLGPCTVTEMLPAKTAVTFSIGLLISLSFAMVITPTMGLLWHDEDLYKMDPMTKYWRLVLGWPVVINVIRLVFYLLFYRNETAQFYFEKYGITDFSCQESRESLEKIYLIKDVDIVLKYMIKIHEKKNKEFKVSFSSLFTKQYRRPMFVAIVFQFFQQFSGIGYFVFYSDKIFNEIGQNGSVASLVLNTSMFLAAFVAIPLVNKFGRKTNFIIGILVQAISFLGFAMMNYFKWFT